MAILDIYVDPGVTTNPNSGAGTVGNPYNHIGQTTQAASANELRIHCARSTQEVITNWRLTGGVAQTGKVKFDTWETYDGRTQRPRISGSRLVSLTWTRGSLTSVNGGLELSWAADGVGNAWAASGPEMTETNMFTGFSQPTAGYPEGTPMPRRKMNESTTDAPGDPAQMPDTNGQWGVTSNSRVVMWSTGGISPGTRFGQFYIRYQPYVDSTTNGSRLMQCRPEGGFEMNGFEFQHVQILLQLLARAGTNSAPIDGVKIWDNWFDSCGRNLLVSGAGVGDPLNSDDYTTYTAGFVNLRYMFNVCRNQGQNIFQCLSGPSLNDAIIAGNTVLECGGVYSDAAIYLDGYAHTTNGRWIQVMRNYIEKMIFGNVWQVDGCALYSENFSAWVWFLYNLVVDADCPMVCNSPRRVFKATRNWLLNRAVTSNPSTVKHAIRCQGGGAGDYTQWVSGPARFYVEENAMLNHPVIIGSAPTGWSTGVDHKILVRNNVIAVEGTPTTGRILVQAKDSNAAGFYDVNGNVVSGMQANLWTYQSSGGGVISNSNIKNLDLTDRTSLLRGMLDALPSKETIWANKDNPALRLPARAPKQCTGSDVSGVSLLSASL